MNQNKRNAFLSSLKIENPGSDPVLPHSPILEKLGLLNLPDYIKTHISDDGKYLEIKIAENSHNWNEFDDYEDENTKCKNHHLIFRIPLQEKDFSYLYNSDESDYIFGRYARFQNDYSFKLLSYSKQEAKFLQERFPGLLFKIKIREKSLPSYERKMDQRISEDKPLDINDIYAERIIVYSYQDSSDEQILSNICYEIAEALEEFRQDTNYSIKTNNLTSSIARSNRPYLSKDYFEHPKENGYKSLHISLEDINNSDCSFETQVRTEKMERDSKLNCEQSHKKYKPRLFDERSILRIPTYHEIDNFSGELEFISPIPTSTTFYHYYQKPLHQYCDEYALVDEIVDFESLSDKAKHLYEKDSNKETAECEIEI